MKFGTTSFIIILIILAVLIGGVRYYYLPTFHPQLLKENLAQVLPSPSPAPTATPSAELKAGSIATVSAELLTTLTPRQKVAQLVAVPISVPTSERADAIASAAATIQNEVPGFVTLFGQGISALQADRMTSELKSIAIQPRMIATQPTLLEYQRQFLAPLIAVDHEGGSVQRLSGEGMTAIPSAAEQCTLDRGSLKLVTDRAAKELAGVGIDIVFAPVVDVGSNNPALRTRLCSDNVDVVRTFATLWIDALQAQRLIPVIKHFPGIGQTTVDLHKKSETISFNPIEHSVFIGLLGLNPDLGVMTTHVSLKNVDGSTTLPCTISEECVSMLELQFPHLIFTDGLEMASAQGSSTASAAAKADGKQSLSALAIGSVESGHTVIVLGKTVTPDQVDTIVSDLADRYQRNPLFKQKVDAALRTIWQAKYAHWLKQGTLKAIP